MILEPMSFSTCSIFPSDEITKQITAAFWIACCFILDPCCLPQLDDNLDHVLWMIRKPGREDCRHNPEKVKETTFLYKIKLIDSRSKQLNFIQESEQLISLVF